MVDCGSSQESECREESHLTDISHKLPVYFEYLLSITMFVYISFRVYKQFKIVVESVHVTDTSITYDDKSPWSKFQYYTVFDTRFLSLHTSSCKVNKDKTEKH